MCFPSSCTWYFFLRSSCCFPAAVKTHSTSPTSRSRVTMELSPHPNDIRVRSLHMSVSWKVTIPIVKDAFRYSLNLANLDIRQREKVPPTLSPTNLPISHQTLSILSNQNTLWEIGVLVLRLGGDVPWSIGRVLISLTVYSRNF